MGKELTAQVPGAEEAGATAEKITVGIAQCRMAEEVHLDTARRKGAHSSPVPAVPWKDEMSSTAVLTGVGEKHVSCRGAGEGLLSGILTPWCGGFCSSFPEKRQCAVRTLTHSFLRHPSLHLQWRLEL